MSDGKFDRLVPKYDFPTIPPQILEGVERQAELIRSVERITKISDTVARLPNSIVRDHDSLANLTSYATRLAESQNKLIDSLKLPKFLVETGAGLDLGKVLPSVRLTELGLASMAAQSVLPTVSKLAMRHVQIVESPFLQSISTNLAELTFRSNDLVVAASESTAVAQLSYLALYAPLECYREAKVVEGFASHTEERQSESDPIEDDVAQKIATADTHLSLENLLASLDSDLLPLLIGARSAMEGSNPDRNRHAITSIRELFTHVLNALAPTDQVAGWTTNSEHFHDGRPTRKARLLYICREFDFQPLGNFVQKDVDASLTLIDHLQKGTHSVRSNLTDAQLRAILARMESLLVYLISIRTA